MIGRISVLISLVTLTAAAISHPYTAMADCRSTLSRAVPTRADARVIEPGALLDQQLSSVESHAYRINVAAGNYVHFLLDQRGIDVTLSLFGPGEKRIAEINEARTAFGVEQVFIVTENDAEYRIEVHPAEADLASGHYGISVDEIRLATTQDRTRFAAEMAYFEGQSLRRQSRADAVRSALAKFTEARQTWEQLADSRGQALALTRIGEVQARLGENQEALESFRRALSIAQSEADTEGQTTVLIDIGSVNYDLGDKQSATQYYEQALRLDQTKNNSADAARALAGMGLVDWSVGEYEKGLQHCQFSLTQANAAGDRPDQSSALVTIGLIYNSYGDNPKALENYAKALTIQRAIGDCQEIASTLLLTGLVYGSSSEHERALDYYDQALAVNRETGDRRGEGQTLNYVGQVYYTLNELQKALDYYEQSLPIRRAVGDRVGEAITLNNIGAVYRATGDSKRALEYYNLSLQLRVAVSDRSGESLTLSNIGSIYRSQGDYQKALEYYNRALDIQRTIGNRLVESSILSSMGAIYRIQGDYKKSLDSYTQSLKLKRAIDDQIGEATTLFEIARIQRTLGNASEASTQVEAAIDFVESMRAKVSRRDLRNSFFAANHNIYEFYIDLLMQSSREGSRDNAIAALLASERGRARTLVDTLLEAGADIRQGMDPELVASERRLQRELNARGDRLTRLLIGKHTAEQEQSARQQLDLVLADYERVESQIRQGSPRYAALMQTNRMTLKEIQQGVLDSDSLLLEYSLGEERSYVWAVTPTGVEGFQLPGRVAIETAARRVHSLLTEHQSHIKDETPERRTARLLQAEKEFHNASAALSQMLLGPVASQLGTKRLVVVADGALQYIPFAALPVPIEHTAEALGNSVTYRPLITEHEVVSLPSVSALAVLRQDLSIRTAAPKTVAVLADPVYTIEDPRIKVSITKSAPEAPRRVATRPPEVVRSANESGLTNFRRLRFSREEAETIATLAAGRELTALDFEASRATATSAKLNEYRILHFAAHGLLNSNHPELSGLVLSLVDQQGKSQDGFLRIHEIYNLKLNADLVVLSACQTALGKEIRGEGLVGLTRGFMYAGAARVIASLWNVEDRATAELMKRFYKSMLSDHMSPAAALRRAQLDLMKEKGWEAPYYWAAFTLQGEWR